MRRRTHGGTLAWVNSIPSLEQEVGTITTGSHGPGHNYHRFPHLGQPVAHYARLLVLVCESRAGALATSGSHSPSRWWPVEAHYDARVVMPQTVKIQNAVRS